MKYDMKVYSDVVAESLLSKNVEGRRNVFADPITMMIVSTLINVAIQFLIPIIQKKCKARADRIKSGVESPSFLTRFRTNWALKQAEYKTRNQLSTYGITHNDASNAIFQLVANMDEGEIQEIIGG